MFPLNKEYVDVRLEFTMKRLGVNIKKLRKSRKWSQQYLASVIGTSQSLVHDLENNTGYNPTIFTIVKVSSAFGLTVSEILNPHLKL